ncbi:MAG: hypothetical protein R3293_19175 [Candidatus Promineifilaceae bacterium]|nr:hypothetical protein [Candidatus Promineifilaceae bacterium]
MVERSEGKSGEWSANAWDAEPVEAYLTATERSQETDDERRTTNGQ